MQLALPVYEGQVTSPDGSILAFLLGSLSQILVKLCQGCVTLQHPPAVINGAVDLGKSHIVEVSEF